MAYTRPSGNAAAFNTGFIDFPRAYNALGFHIPGATYTAPTGHAVNFQFLPDRSDTARPLGDAVNFTAYYDLIVSGFGECSVGFSAVGHGAIGDGGTASTSVSITATGTGKHGVKGVASTSVGLAATGTGKHGVKGVASASYNNFTAAAVGTVVRYELRGDVRLMGVPVDRTVRVYRRDTGALVAEGDTTFGRFRIHTGFSAQEHYLVPVNLASDADDWSPPCANRVLSVLAQDVA